MNWNKALGHVEETAIAFSHCFAVGSPSDWLFFFLKYLLPFWVVECQLGPSGAIFLNITGLLFYSKIHFHMSLKLFLSSTLQWSLYYNQLAINRIPKRSVGMGMPAGFPAAVWMMDTDINPIHMLSSTESFM